MWQCYWLSVYIMYTLCVIHVFIGGVHAAIVCLRSCVYGHVADFFFWEEKYKTIRMGGGYYGKKFKREVELYITTSTFRPNNFSIFSIRPNNFSIFKIIKTNSLNNSRKNKKREKISFLSFKYLHDLYSHRFSIKFYFFFFLLSKPIYLP